MSRLEDRLGFDLATLETFVTVFETGSMTEASVKLGLTESAISHTIRGLERRLKLPLFDRRVRPIKPTTLGVQFYERGRRLLVEANGITQDLRAMGRVAHTKLRLGVIETMGSWFAARLIQNLSASATSWTLTIDSNDELWQRFDARELDVLVVIDDERGHPEADQRPLLRETGILAAPASLSHLSLRELAADQPLIGAHGNSGFGRLTSRFLSRARIEKPLTCAMDNLEGVLIMVSLGFGWAILPSLLLLRATHERDQIAVQPLEPPGLTRRIMLVTRKFELGDLADVVMNEATRVIQRQLALTQIDQPALANIISITVDTATANSR